MKTIFTIICLLMLGCDTVIDMALDENHADVYMSTVDFDQLYDIGGADNLLGYTAFTGAETCHVFMLPKPEYGNDACYNATLGHEIRHCFEGTWHGNERIAEPACQGMVK